MNCGSRVIALTQVAGNLVGLLLWSHYTSRHHHGYSDEIYCYDERTASRSGYFSGSFISHMKILSPSEGVDSLPAAFIWTLIVTGGILIGLTVAFLRIGSTTSSSSVKRSPDSGALWRAFHSHGFQSRVVYTQAKGPGGMRRHHKRRL